MKKLALALVFFLIVLYPATAQTFVEQQLKFVKVQQAKEDTDDILKKAFNDKGLNYPPENVFIRGIKYNGALELWGKNANQKEYTLVKTYTFCRLSGDLGPKRREWDGQVPEGFYYVNQFNPFSNYFVSMQINYPNKSDLILGDSARPGSLISIHGGCATIGCIPILDENIKELYWACIQAVSFGQPRVEVHLFPMKLTEENMQKLKERYPYRPKTYTFWENLKQGYDFFEKNHYLPKVSVNPDGKYIFQ